MLYNLIITPIETVVDWVFLFINNRMPSLGVIGAIFGVSIVINFLALPLYNIAERLQQKERDINRKLADRVKKIKKAFKGDEQFMMLSTYYRQNNYHPLYTLRNALTILIEIPFFIAAYHYLNNSEALKNASFWLFKDLGAPDGLLQFTLEAKLITINILPIIMTLINFVSGAIYTKGGTFREKFQLYAVSLLFLLLLYNSPSGLVIYWILNNLFSLIKNIVMRLKHQKLIVYICYCFILLCLSISIFHDGIITKKRIFFTFAIITLILLPIIIHFVKKLISKNHKLYKYFITDETLNNKTKSQNFILFLFVCIGLTLLCGWVLPTSIIGTSPIEFSFLGTTNSPLTYIWICLNIFAGFFLFWPVVIYFLFNDKIKKVLPFIMCVLFLLFLGNVYIFKTDIGTVDITFKISNEGALKIFSLKHIFISLIYLISCITLLLIIKLFKKQKFLTLFIFSLCIAEFSFGLIKISHIQNTYTKFAQNIEKNANPNKNKTKFEPIFHLTKTGKNVIILFLDRAIGAFMMSSLEDIPELQSQLSGCVFYPNTISYSTNTVLGFPPLGAGYEYTPEKINSRSDELLVDKHNEASLVMPTLFANGGFYSTIVDPPFPNYTWSGDLSAFEKKENITAFELSNNYATSYKIEHNVIEGNSLDKIAKKEISNFIVLQIIPKFIRNTFYSHCREKYSDSAFIEQFSTLYYLDKITDFTGNQNQFIMIDNETTHSPCYLDSSFFIPVSSKSEAANISYKTNSELTATHYYSFVASMKAIGKWFDYLRENSAYDNTRIIIVADHGRYLPLNEFEHFENSSIPASYYPLFIVKDFNSNAPFQIDNTFMTHADTIFFAKKGLNLSNKNPFTGNEFVVEKKDGVNIYGVNGTEWNAEQMIDKTKFTLLYENAWHVKDNIFDKENWTRLSDIKQKDNLKNSGGVK